MISQKQYVNRLEKMLKVDKPCGTCPMAKRFMNIEFMSLPTDWAIIGTHYGGSIDEDICYMCHDFIGVENEYHPCPCDYFKRRSTALKRAHKAIIAYRNSTHKWCKK